MEVLARLVVEHFLSQSNHSIPDGRPDAPIKNRGLLFFATFYEELKPKEKKKAFSHLESFITVCRVYRIRRVINKYSKNKKTHDEVEEDRLRPHHSVDGCDCCVVFRYDGCRRREALISSSRV